MELNEDILSEYKSHRKAYSEKLEYFTNKLDEVENLIDDLMFEKDEILDIDESELSNIADEEIQGIEIKTKELKELLLDTKKVIKTIKNFEEKKKIYNKK